MQNLHFVGNVVFPGDRIAPSCHIIYLVLYKLSMFLLCATGLTIPQLDVLCTWPRTCFSHLHYDVAHLLFKFFPHLLSVLFVYIICPWRSSCFACVFLGANATFEYAILWSVAQPALFHYSVAQHRSLIFRLVIVVL